MTKPATDDGVKGLVQVMTVFALVMLAFGFGIGMLISQPSFVFVDSQFVNHGQFYHVVSFDKSSNSLTLTVESKINGITLDSVRLYVRLSNGSLATSPWQQLGHHFTLSSGDTATFAFTNVSPSILTQATYEAVVITQINNNGTLPQIGVFAGDEFPVQINLPV